ncbi:MAG: DUF853 family protein [Betaproteobacteria bacterium]|nr:DUF853 family protein [Betaproteobacteria bacterium]
MGILYAFVMAATAWWLWIVRPSLEERGRHEAAAWAKSAAIAAALLVIPAFSARGVGELLAGWVAATLFINFWRNIWGWLLNQLSLSGQEGDTRAHLRGARLVDGPTLQKILKNEAADLTIGGQKFPARIENLHLLITGATGTGKSVAISEMLDAIQERGDRVFLSDSGGNALKHYYSPERGDVVLNPLDARAVSWSPLAEMAQAWDADLLAKSIVPDGEGSSKEWNGYAQAVASAILKHCWNLDLNNAEIFRLAVVADIGELREIFAFAGTPAQALVAEGNERMFGSIRGIVGTYLTPFQYLDPAAGKNAWSLKKFVEDDRAKGWLFFNFRDDQLATLAPVIAAMTDVVSKSILSLDADPSRRFWLVLDEFASLGKVTSILDFLTKARKAGGRAIIGIQTVAQLRSAYGRDDAQTLLSCLSSQLVLRCPDPETADLMSRMLGEEQIVRQVGSGGESKKILEATTTTENWQEQVATERVVMPAELQNLPDLRGVLNLAGNIPAAPVQLQPIDRPKIAETYVAGQAREIKISKVASAQEQQQNQPQPDRDMTGDLDLI